MLTIMQHIYLHVSHLIITTDLYYALLYRQFEYLDRRGSSYKYTSQLVVIIKREYPGLVQDKNEHGVVLRTRPALEWADYFLSRKDDLGQTAGDRVLSEFWVSNMYFGRLLEKCCCHCSLRYLDLIYIFYTLGT